MWHLSPILPALPCSWPTTSLPPRITCVKSNGVCVSHSTENSVLLFFQHWSVQWEDKKKRNKNLFRSSVVSVSGLEIRFSGCGPEEYFDRIAAAVWSFKSRDTGSIQVKPSSLGSGRATAVALETMLTSIKKTKTKKPSNSKTRGRRVLRTRWPSSWKHSLARKVTYESGMAGVTSKWGQGSSCCLPPPPHLPSSLSLSLSQIRSQRIWSIFGIRLMLTSTKQRTFTPICIYYQITFANSWLVHHRIAALTLTCWLHQQITIINSDSVVHHQTANTK